jgi:putative acetyltransferase
MAAGVPVALRRMQPAELAQTLDVWVASWQAAYPAIDFEARRAWMMERLAQHDREGSACIIAVDAGRICGLLVINVEKGYLDQIAVAPHHQGSGLAEALLDEAKRLAGSGFTLHVNQDNHRAVAFYQKHGLVIVGEDVNPRSGAPIFSMQWRPEAVSRA